MFIWQQPAEPTCWVIASILKPLQSPDEGFKNLLPCPGDSVVHVGEDSCKKKGKPYVYKTLGSCLEEKHFWGNRYHWRLITEGLPGCLQKKVWPSPGIMEEEQNSLPASRRTSYAALLQCQKDSQSMWRTHAHTMALQFHRGEFLLWTYSQKTPFIVATFIIEKISKTKQPPRAIWKSPLCGLLGLHRTHLRRVKRRSPQPPATGRNRGWGLCSTFHLALLLGALPSISTTFTTANIKSSLGLIENPYLQGRPTSLEDFVWLYFLHSYIKIIFSQIGRNSHHVGSFQTPPLPCLRLQTLGLSLSCSVSVPSHYPSVLLPYTGKPSLLKVQLQPHLPGQACPGPGQKCSPALTSWDIYIPWQGHRRLGTWSLFNKCMWIEWPWICIKQGSNSMDREKGLILLRTHYMPGTGLSIATQVSIKARSSLRGWTCHYPPLTFWNWARVRSGTKETWF